MKDKLQMAGIGTRRNSAVHHAIAAIVRAHALMDGASMTKGKEIAERIDRAVAGEMTANVVIALGMLLLRSTGYLDAFNEGRFTTES